MIQDEDVREGMRVRLIADLSHGRRAGDTGTIRMVPSGWGVVFDKEVAWGQDLSVVTVFVVDGEEFPVLNFCGLANEPSRTLYWTRGFLRAVSKGEPVSGEYHYVLLGELPAAVFNLPEHLRGGQPFVLADGQAVFCVGYTEVDGDVWLAVDAVVGEGI